MNIASYLKLLSHVRLESRIVFLPFSTVRKPTAVALLLGLLSPFTARAAIDQVYQHLGRPDDASWIIATATSPDYCSFPAAFAFDVDSGGKTVKKVLLSWTASGDGVHPAPAFRQTSLNGGITFTSPVVTPIGFLNGIRKRNGTMLFLPFSTASQPFTYYTSTNNGDTLTANTNGTASTAHTFDMGVLEENDGTLYVVGYNASGAKISKSTDGGTTWSASGLGNIATNNSPVSGYKYTETSIERCVDGSWLAVMRVDDDHNMRYSRSTDKGVTWTPPALLPGISSVGKAPALKLLPNGILVLAWGQAAGSAGRDCKFAFSADGNGTSWTNITTALDGVTNVLESTGYSAVFPLESNRFMFVSDTGVNWSYTDGYHASDYRVWGHVIDVVPSLKNRIDLDGKNTAGSLTITTDLTALDAGHPEARVTGAFDGSTDFWSSAFKNSTSGSYTIDLQKNYPVNAVGVCLNYNTVQSATIDVSTDAMNWNTVKTYTNATHNALNYTSFAPTSARYVRATVSGAAAPVRLNEIEVYSRADTFENYALDVAPFGYSVPNYGFWVTQTQTPLPSGYQSKRALIMYDGQSGALPTCSKTTTASTSKTLEFRYRSKAFAPGGAHQFLIRSGTTTVYHVAVFADGSIRHYNGSAWVVSAAAGTVPADTWTLIKVVAPISPASASIYVNDVLVGTALKESAVPTTMDTVTFATTGTAPVGDLAVIDDVDFY